MNLERLKDKKVRYGGMVILIIILSLLLWRCESTGVLSVDKAYEKIKSLVKEDERVQEDYNLLLSNTAFEDLCTEVYATKFRELGQRFMDIHSEFMSIKIQGNKREEIPKYEQYQEYFLTYKQIGEELQKFANLVSDGNYQDAVSSIGKLQTLNQQIPIIE